VRPCTSSREGARFALSARHSGETERVGPRPSVRARWQLPADWHPHEQRATVRLTFVCDFNTAASVIAGARIALTAAETEPR